MFLPVQGGSTGCSLAELYTQVSHKPSLRHVQRLILFLLASTRNALDTGSGLNPTVPSAGPLSFQVVILGHQPDSLYCHQSASAYFLFHLVDSIHILKSSSTTCTVYLSLYSSHELLRLCIHTYLYPHSSSSVFNTSILLVSYGDRK
jgi:hypothetical protein